MKLDLTIVDAFCTAPGQVFSGNSAAVIITEQWLSDDLMQQIGRENNLSETAFLIPAENQKPGHYQIRWFSPLTEIDFCGHATLASSYVLFDQHAELTQLHLSAPAVGEMIISRTQSAGDEQGLIQMDFPNRKPEPVDDIPPALLAGLSLRPAQVLRSEQAYFAIYDNDQQVRDLTTMNSELCKLAPYDVVASAAAPEQSPYDCISRYFWPANGGDEDPVTGSIHTGLAPYWAEQLNKDQLLAYQASSRGGVLYCQLMTNQQGEARVIISGHASCYLRGTIEVPE